MIASEKEKIFRIFHLHITHAELAGSASVHRQQSIMNVVAMAQYSVHQTTAKSGDLRERQPCRPEAGKLSPDFAFHGQHNLLGRDSLLREGNHHTRIGVEGLSTVHECLLSASGVHIS